MTCIRCNSEATGKYCPECGQKQNIPRLTLKTFFEDFLNRIYGLDGTVPNTVLGLWKTPGRVAQEYVVGIRGKYVGPVGYYFLMFTVYFILISLLDIDMTEYADTRSINETISQGTGEELDKEKIEFQKNVQQTIFKNLQYFTILFFPLFALWAKVFFKKSNFNFLENLVFVFFTNAQMLFFNMLGIILFALSGETYKIIMSIFGVIYFAWAASEFYTNKVTFKTMIRSTIFYIVAFTSLFVIATFVGIVYGFIHSKIVG